MKDWIARYRKALVAGLATGTGLLVDAMADDKVSSGEWLYIALALLAAGGITAVVPNRPKTKTSTSGS